MSRTPVLAIMLAAALTAGGQLALSAEGESARDELDRLIPAGSAVSLEAWRAIFRDGRDGGHLAVRTLAEERNWPALRAVVERGRDDIAASWATAYYVGYRPRWTAAEYARRLREWLKANPDPEEAAGGGFPPFPLKDLDQFLAVRDKKLAAQLAAELMASRSATAARTGCGLAGLSGDRRLARQLLGLLRERQPGLSPAAAEALAVLRSPASLSDVRDRELASALASAAASPRLAVEIEPGRGLAALAATLPGRERLDRPAALLAAAEVSEETRADVPTPAPAPNPGAGDAEAREQIRRGLKVFDGPAQMELNWSACLTAASLGLEHEACRTARMLVMYDYARGGAGEVTALVAARYKSRELVPDLGAAALRSDVALGTRIWALGEIGDRAAVPTLVEVGLDPRWVVTVARSLPEALHEAAAGNGASAFRRFGERRLLVEVTAETLEKLTGHRLFVASPEDLAVGWRRWYEANRRSFGK